MEKLLKPEAVAEITGISKGALSQQRFHGTGIPFIKIGGAVRYHPRDVEAYIEANRRTQTGNLASA